MDEALSHDQEVCGKTFYKEEYHFVADCSNSEKILYCKQNKHVLSLPKLPGRPVSRLLIPLDVRKRPLVINSQI